MRKSSRETKKPEVFAFLDAVPSKSKSDMEIADDEDNMDSSQSIEKPTRKVHKIFDSVGKGGHQSEDLFGKLTLDVFLQNSFMTFCCFVSLRHGECK